MKTIKQKTEKVIDASGIGLGRVASNIAMHLMGKTDPSFKRNVYSGFPVKVTNAGKIKITSKKLGEIFHTRYSGYPGGLKITKASETKEKKGMKELLKLSVFNMLPDNKLRREMMKNLTIEE